MLWIIILSLVALIVLAILFFRWQIKTNGKIMLWLLPRLMRSQKISAAVTNQLHAQLADGNNEDIIEQISNQQGVDRKVAAQALEQYVKMKPEQQKKIITMAAQGKIDATEIKNLQSNMNQTPRVSMSKAGPKKAKNRAANKAARNQRRRSR
jgi:hypothetical protein